MRVISRDKSSINFRIKCLTPPRCALYYGWGTGLGVPGVPAGRRLRLLPPEFSGVAACDSWLAPPALLYPLPPPPLAPAVAAVSCCCKSITAVLLGSQTLSWRICAACASSCWAVMEAHSSNPPAACFAAFDLL